MSKSESAFDDMAAAVGIRSSPSDLALLSVHKANLEDMARLARNAAHSINNVLAVSRGNVLLLRESAGDEDSRAMLDDVLLSLGFAASLSASLVDVANHEPVSLELVEMGEFLDQHLQSLRYIVGLDNAIQLQASKAKVHVLTDRRYLELAIRAMVRNALEAAGPDCAVVIKCAIVRAAASREDQSGRQDFVDIVVSDNGPGFSAQARAHAFDAGFSTRGRGHAGLGLWLVRQVALVSRGNARVIVRSAGKGAAVALRLPCTRD